MFLTSALNLSGIHGHGGKECESWGLRARDFDGLGAPFKPMISFASPFTDPQRAFAVGDHLNPIFATAY